MSRNNWAGMIGKMMVIVITISLFATAVLAAWSYPGKLGSGVGLSAGQSKCAEVAHRTYIGSNLVVCKTRLFSGATTCIWQSSGTALCGVTDPSVGTNNCVNWYRDADGDGYTTNTAAKFDAQFPPASGYESQPEGDCNDADAAIKPGATESCDGIDNDCNTATADGSGQTAPAASKTAGVCAGQVKICASGAWQEPVYTSITNYQSTETICDGLDNDCDNSVDESSTVTCPSGQYCAGTQGCISSCTPTTEVCDNVDNDCDNKIDEGSDGIEGSLKNTYYRDADGDTYGSPTVTTRACTQPSGYLTDNTDCIDNNNAIHPDATEICNGINDDCDTQTDEGIIPITTGCVQTGACSGAEKTCTAGAWSACSKLPTTETCNGIDDDCDTETDEGCGCTAPTPCGSYRNCVAYTTYYQDSDGDGYGVTNLPTQACTRPNGYSIAGGDCNDISANNGAAVNPGVIEGPAAPSTWNGINDDCDEFIDEGFGTFCTFGTPNRQCGETDEGVCQFGTQQCFNGVWQPCAGNIDPPTIPSEACDNLDNDCDGDPNDNGVTETWYGQTCDGADLDLCNEGTYQCINGGRICSDVSGDSIEICDDLDNDCDGFVNEGNPCASTKDIIITDINFEPADTKKLNVGYEDLTIVPTLGQTGLSTSDYFKIKVDAFDIKGTLADRCTTITRYVEGHPNYPNQIFDNFRCTLMNINKKYTYRFNTIVDIDGDIEELNENNNLINENADVGFSTCEQDSECNDDNSCTDEYCGPNDICVYTIKSYCCGNRICEAGEVCATYNSNGDYIGGCSDCGVCSPNCQAGTTLCSDATCSANCGINSLTCGSDSTCDSYEGCGCASCAGRQSVCGEGLICNAITRVCDDILNPVLNNGICSESENCVTSPADCGVCGDQSGWCGNGNCETDETISSCRRDCPLSHSSCSVGTTLCLDDTCQNCDENNLLACNDNGVCDINEVCTCDDCAGYQTNCENGLLCSAITQVCELISSPVKNDGVCSSAENCVTSPADCGGCLDPEYCGDETCNDGEIYRICGRDCPLSEVRCQTGMTLCSDGTCAANCGTNIPACNNDGACSAEEGCTCADCAGQQLNCVDSLRCNIVTETCDNIPAPAIDGICSASENCVTSPADCGTCGTGLIYCGNSICDDGETRASCGRDCPAASTYCADGMTLCLNGNCAADCGTNIPVCDADSICDSGEGCTCVDCAGRESICQDGLICNTVDEICDNIDVPDKDDGVCSSSENCLTSPSDCGACTEQTYCGDDNCDADETSSSCVRDCVIIPSTCAAGTTLCSDNQCRADCGTEIPVCDTDTTCDAGEGCTCADCYGKQSSCVEGAGCNANTHVCTVCNTAADTNCDGCVTINEASNRVLKWKQGLITIQEASNAILKWKTGQGCSV